jgi:hypothetical protein
VPIRRGIAGTIFLIVALAIAIPIQGTHAEPKSPAAPPLLAADATCEEILTRAMQSVQSTCNDVSRNNACYGSNQVKAEPNGGAALKFDVVGDRAPIRNIRTMVTSPLNVETGTWGLSLLKLQANLPDTLPGQNVTFLVFGNTSVENVSGDMQSFYFTTGIGNLSCKTVPKDAIVVRSPQHTEITFTANGVQITIASTIVLRAERNKSMSVELVEGSAKLTAAGKSQTLKPGQVSTVTLGGVNGLTATDAPSTPSAAASDAALGPVFVTAGKVGDPDAAVNISVEGCITNVQGNTVTVNDYQINVGTDGALKNAKVGDCVHVDGTLKVGDDNKVKFDVVKAQPAASASASASASGGGKPAGSGKPSVTGKDNAATKTAENANASAGSGNGNPGGNGNGGGGNGGGNGGNGGGNGGGGNGGGNGGGGN